MDYIILAFVWLSFSLIVASYSSNKMLGFWGGLVISLCLSPAVGLLIALSSRDCKSMFCLRFGKRMKEIKRAQYRGNREAALEKLKLITVRLQRIMQHADNPEHYYLYRQRVTDKLQELGGEIPEGWREA